MKKNELFRDWEFRYRYIYRKRRTKRVNSVFFQHSIRYLQYENRCDSHCLRYASLPIKNIYVGDIEKQRKLSVLITIHPFMH